MPDTPAIDTAGENDQTPSRPLWTSAEILAATHGRLEGEAFAASGVNFNSQEIEAGDLFVALKGARDGHEFVPGAFGRDAAGALVEHPVEGGSCVVVPDTLKGLEALGVAARQRARLRAAVTGSVGKTSVTQAIKAGLDLAGTSHASIKSFNNHIGVPLTLARTPHGTERAVFEIGMNAPGEIAPLSHLVRPHAACVTTIGPVHIEAFEDAERGVAREKASIFDGLIEGGVAVIPADTPHDAVLRAAAQRAGARIRTFGARHGADARLIGFNPTPQGGRGRFELDGRTHDFTLSQSGVHWGLNTLCVVLMLEAMDVPVETALAALAGFQPLAGRGQSRTVHVDGGAFTLIDESYNANPLSMAAGFKSLAARPVTGSGRRIVVLSDMLELGVQSRSLHEGLAGAIEAAGLDLVHTAGSEMRALHAALPEHRRGLWRETAQALAEAASELAGPGDLVMVKGSNGSKASLVAAALAALDAGADTAKLDKAPVSRKRAAPSKAASRAPSKPSAPRGRKAD